MQLLTCHKGKLHTDKVAAWDWRANKKSFATGLRALDELLPNGALARGAMHELLTLPTHSSPFFVALFIARAAIKKRNQPQINTDEHRLKKDVIHELTRMNTNEKAVHESARMHTNQTASLIRVNSCQFVDSNLCSSVFICGSNSIVWCDPSGKLYPPAVAALGVPLDRLFMLRRKTIADENWAIAECLRCRGVSATIASPRRLSRIEARRFQLAAERGGGVGILLRRYDRTANIYSAATRWLVAPARGERTIQRWKIQLIHGHGGRVGQAVILEHHRENNSIQVHSLRQVEQLADRSIQKASA